MRKSGIASLLTVAIFAGAAFTNAAPLAASPGPPADATSPIPISPQAEKPSAARVSAIEGSLSIARGEGQKPVAGTLNAPVFPGDYLSSGADSRAEIQLDGFTMLRLGANVQARLASGTTQGHRLELADGTVEVAMLHAEPAVTTIDTPSVTIKIVSPGDVRVSVASGVTTATARAGTASIDTPQRSDAMQSGKTYVASGSASAPAIETRSEIAYDAFDDYNAHRDTATLATIGNSPNLPSSLAGYDDLNASGRWTSITPYGFVWIPSGVASDWAPYRDGQWTWSAAYGWTWVSNETWGWVPYHYGRWFYQDGYGWCWLPPDASSVVVWQPALVVFFGWGASTTWNWGGGYGNVGWVPLAPNEAYVPWYAGGYDHWISVTTPVHRKLPVLPRPYRNAAYATTVAASAFHQGDFARAKAVDMNHADNAAVLSGPLPIVVTPQNMIYARTPVTTAKARQGSAWDRFDDARVGRDPYPLEPHAGGAPVVPHAAGTPPPSHVSPLRTAPPREPAPEKHDPSPSPRPPRG